MGKLKSDLIPNCFYSRVSSASRRNIPNCFYSFHRHYPQLFLQSGFMGKISSHNVAYEALNYDIKMVEIFTFSSLISGKAFCLQQLFITKQCYCAIITELFLFLLML